MATMAKSNLSPERMAASWMVHIGLGAALILRRERSASHRS